MIASVTGLVAVVAGSGAVVEVGGVGLLVQCTPATLSSLRVGEPATLHTSLVVREDALTLYGFADADERATFELLQSATGVGPRLAQAVLAVHPPAAVRRAVATEDLAALTLVPGIGRKGAQRLILELRDRIGEVAEDGGSGAAWDAGLRAAGVPAWREQVRDALCGLGYTVREADEAVARVEPAGVGTNGSTPDGATGAGTDVDVAALLRAALAVLRPR